MAPSGAGGCGCGFGKAGEGGKGGSEAVRTAAAAVVARDAAENGGRGGGGGATTAMWGTHVCALVGEIAVLGDHHLEGLLEADGRVVDLVLEEHPLTCPDNGPWEMT